MKPENFGKNLNKIRLALNLTQVDISRATGLTPAAVSQILNHNREPSLKTICAILKYIPVKFEKLVE